MPEDDFYEQEFNDDLMQVDHILMRDRVYFTHFPLLHKFRSITLTLAKEILRIEDKVPVQQAVEESSKPTADSKKVAEKPKVVPKEKLNENEAEKSKSGNEEESEEEHTELSKPVENENTRLVKAYDWIDLEETKRFVASQKLDIMYINNFKDEEVEEQQ